MSLPWREIKVSCMTWVEVLGGSLLSKVAPIIRGEACQIWWYFRIPEFTAFKGTVRTGEYRFFSFNCCMFCEVHLYLLSCSCEYCCSVSSYFVSSGP